MFYSIISAAAVRFRRVPSAQYFSSEKRIFLSFRKPAIVLYFLYLFQREPASRKIRHKSSGERKAKIDQESRPKGIAGELTI
jgi:hypothetical protein